MSKKSLPQTSSRQLAIMYFVTFAVNALVLYTANMMFPKNVVLGNAALSPMWAILLSGGALALIATLAVPVIEYAQEQMDKPLEMMHWIAAYLVVNFAAIWLVSRAAEQFGFGISAWWVGLILAGVMDFLQGMGSMLVYGKK